MASDEVARRLQIMQGACLQSVESDGAAAIAGLLPMRRGLSGIVAGDVIVAVAERPVVNGSELFKELDQYQVREPIGRVSTLQPVSGS